MTNGGAPGGSGRDRRGRLHAEAVPRPDGVLDVMGLYCPVPVMRTAVAVRRMEPGRILEVLADDPVALVDLPNWCATAGHRYLGWIDGEAGELRLFLQVQAGRLPSRRARE